ncbi:MAG: hypothetical protein AB1389_01750 [Campylobacterota bacterium]
MSKKNTKVQCYDSMRSSTASQRSNTPNTTQPAKPKPTFVPPAQNVKKSS